MQVILFSFFKDLIFIFNSLSHVCVYVCLYGHKYKCLWRPGEDIGCLGTETAGCCEQLHVGSGNGAKVVSSVRALYTLNLDLFLQPFLSL